MYSLLRSIRKTFSFKLVLAYTWLAFFLRSPFTYGLLSYLRNNSFPGNLFMSYLLVFLLPTFAPPLTFTGTEESSMPSNNEYGALVPCVNILFLFMNVFKVTTKDLPSTYSNLSNFRFFCWLVFEVAKNLSNSEENAQMIRPKWSARRSMNGTEAYFFNTNKQRVEVSVAKLLWILLIEI